MEVKINGVDATELCEKKKNCWPSWVVGKKRSGIVLLIDTFLLSVLTTEACLVFSSWNDFYLDTC